jgi:hypothetical protein
MVLRSCHREFTTRPRKARPPSRSAAPRCGCSTARHAMPTGTDRVRLATATFHSGKWRGGAPCPKRIGRCCGRPYPAVRARHPGRPAPLPRPETDPAGHALTASHGDGHGRHRSQADRLPSTSSDAPDRHGLRDSHRPRRLVRKRATASTRAGRIYLNPQIGPSPGGHGNGCNGLIERHERNAQMLIMALVVPVAALVIVLGLARFEAVLLDGDGVPTPASGERDDPATKPGPRRPDR